MPEGESHSVGKLKSSISLIFKPPQSEYIHINRSKISCKADGLHPSDNVESPANPICGNKENGKRFEPVCPNATWGEKNERPLCNEVINLLCVGRDDQVPFFISVHGTQLKPVRTYLSAMGLRKKSLYEYQAVMSLKETSNQKGKFFVIQFEDLKENKGDDKEVFRSMFFQYSGRSIDQTFEAEKKMKDDLSDVPFAGLATGAVFLRNYRFCSNF